MDDTATLSRIADALDRIAAALERGAHPAVTSAPPQQAAQPAVPDARERLLAALGGKVATTFEIRDALGLKGYSARAVAAVADAAGFPRKRVAAGVAFVIGDVDEGSKRRSPTVELPPNIDRVIAMAREAFEKHGRKTTPRAIMYLSRDPRFGGTQGYVTQAHIDMLAERVAGEPYIEGV